MATASGYTSRERVPVVDLSKGPFNITIDVRLLVHPTLRGVVRSPSVNLGRMGNVVTSGFRGKVGNHHFVQTCLRGKGFRLPGNLRSGKILDSVTNYGYLVSAGAVRGRRDEDLGTKSGINTVLL